MLTRRCVRGRKNLDNSVGPVGRWTRGEEDYGAMSIEQTDQWSQSSSGIGLPPVCSFRLDQEHLQAPFCCFLGGLDDG